MAGGILLIFWVFGMHFQHLPMLKYHVGAMASSAGNCGEMLQLFPDSPVPTLLYEKRFWRCKRSVNAVGSECGLGIMNRRAQTQVHLGARCVGAMTGIMGMWDTAVRGSFGCKLLRACESRRVPVSPVVQSCAL